METDFSDYSQATTSGPDFSSASMGLSDEAMASIGSDENQDQNFFGGPDTPNVMDFGRGSVSNISNAANFDPNFAALNMIGRGLTPSSALRNQISFDVPSQMLPQIEGRLGPTGPKFYSEAERFLQEDVTDFVKAGPGIAGMIGNFLSDNFKDAKNALGKMGDAVGGLDMMGIFSSDTGQKAMADMEDNVSFDQFGRRIDLGDTRQISNFPQVQIPTVDTTPNLLDTNMDMADASTFNVLQGLGTKFNPQINEILRQNVSPNLKFESDMRPDVNDPDKFMPYMGLRYDFSTA